MSEIRVRPAVAGLRRDMQLLKSPQALVYFLAALISVAVAVWVAGGAPPVPVTVKRYVPCAVEELTVIVSAEELVAGFGLKLPVAPAGRPLTDKVTGELKPPVDAIVTV